MRLQLLLPLFEAGGDVRGREGGYGRRDRNISYGRGWRKKKNEDRARAR